MNISHKPLSDAVKSLILSHPLFAGILLQQKFVEDKSVPTCCVDGEAFAFNPDFLDTLSFDQLKFVCAHEAAHLLLCHHARMGNREHELANRSMDFAVNWMLKESGFSLWEKACFEERFASKSFEDIYRTLFDEREANKPKPETQPESKQESKPDDAQGEDDSDNGAGDSDSDSEGQGDEGNGKGDDPTDESDGAGDGSGSESDSVSIGEVKPSPNQSAPEAEAKAKGQVEKAMSIARMAGALPGGLEREIKAAEAPRMDWREILHRFFQEWTKSDYSFAAPNPRFAHRGVILPSLKSRNLGKVVLAVDTSGSVSDDEVSAMVAEMQNCMESYTDEGITGGLTVIYCDAQVTGVEVLYSGDVPTPKGGGGTMFAPVFQYLSENGLDGAACLVYLTDGFCADTMESLDALAPSFPVLWGLIQDNADFMGKVPFGECFKMDIHA